MPRAEGLDSRQNGQQSTHSVTSFATPDCSSRILPPDRCSLSLDSACAGTPRCWPRSLITPSPTCCVSHFSNSRGHRCHV